MKKKIILLAHGFMVHDSHDFTWFYEYISKEFKDYEFKMIYLYDRKIGESSKPKNMIRYLKSEVQKYLDLDYDVSLIGYSFSCNLVAKVAKDLKLKGVIYFAPAIKLLKTKLFSMHVKNAFKTLKLRLKHGKKKAKKIMDRTKTSGVVLLSLHISLTMLKYRKYFKSNVPFLIIRGTEDTYCLQDDVTWILKNTSAAHVKTITKQGEGWNHFFVRRDYLSPYVSHEVMNFLEGVWKDENEK